MTIRMRRLHVLTLKEEPKNAEFKDSELMGVPERIAVSMPGLNVGHVEVKIRRGGEVLSIPLDAVSNWLGEDLL